ncbi:LysR family transcriptional regulator [Oricola sp.]|uniref:LysR family transcriptional regulator n=1 Tax=Oricola sp. TaxID=1979950 RepID=UPI0025FB7007|nr:LysR family transcriptional regulator [Oricola sp.]MCI5076017.1 LysR family transcriptional regulator [Oricola sp.]
MDVFSNIKAFLTVARLGSFSAAAREAHTVPSVISKRISQLEHQLKTQLFMRSTRGLELTEAGYGYQQRFIALMDELDSALAGGDGAALPQEHIRIKCPSTLLAMHLSDVLIKFRIENPGVRIDLIMIDRTVNPLEEGYDLALGALPATYPHVLDVPLCPLPRMIVASPDYLRRRGLPTHPRDLANHDCIIFPASGTRWTFDGPSGESSVEVNSVFSTTDSRILRDAAVAGVGVTIVSEYMARLPLDAGRLVEILPDYKVPELYMKVLVPESRKTSPTVRAIVEALVSASQPMPPWERD